MDSLFKALLPEIILTVAACALFLMGVSPRAATRRLTPIVALAALLGALIGQYWFWAWGDKVLSDPSNTVHVYQFAAYIKILAAAMGILLVLLAWPGNADATGGSSLHFGQEAGEFYGLMLLSIAGVFLVAGSNDIMLLFLGIELASIPTYIMVSVSRPLAVAQEAGVKYFFLGAMSAAVMLFGFSYLYGTTGTTKLDEIQRIFTSTYGHWTPWQMLAVVMLIAGFAFKMAAFPLQVYAGDVYQGAATPVTAFLSFVPKTSGFVALIKILFAVGGQDWRVPVQIQELLWVIAVLTMFFGNVLGLLQFNIKRVLAYSSIAHSGYMLVGVTALVTGVSEIEHASALRGVIFYLTAYGVMNIAAFGVLILLPAREPKAATSAETFEDIAGLGRRHVALGLAMAVSCFSLIGIPLTIGFLGKVYLILPALHAGLIWLAVLTMVNAAISAAYYLKIVAAMFLRPEPQPFSPVAAQAAAPPQYQTAPVALAVLLSVLAVLGFGIVLPMADGLSGSAQAAARIEPLGPISPPLVSAAP